MRPNVLALARRYAKLVLSRVETPPARPSSDIPPQPAVLADVEKDPTVGPIAVKKVLSL